MQRIKVAVLRGGPGAESEVSMKSGKNILENLPEKYIPIDVIVDKNNRIVSTGYNGTPKGTSGLPTHRPEKYPYMVHAEQNAIIFAKQDLTDCKIYILGMLPCDTCARLICQSGIKQVFVVNESIRYGGADWKPTEVLEMFRQCKVTVKQVETSPINFY